MTWSGFIGLGTIASGTFTEPTATGYVRMPFTFSSPRNGICQGNGPKVRFTSTSSITTINSFGFYSALSGGTVVLAYPIPLPVAFGLHADVDVTPYTVSIDIIDDLSSSGLALDPTGISTISGITAGSSQTTIAANSVLGNSTGSSALPTAVTLGPGLTFSGTTIIPRLGGGLAIDGSNNIISTGTVASVNLTTALGLQVNGVPMMNFVNGGASNVFGINAGAALPSNDSESVAIGTNALNAYGSATGENTVIGWGSMRSLAGGLSNVITTAVTTTSPIITFATTQLSNLVGLFAIGAGIPDGTTVVSNTLVAATLSASVTVASGTTVSFAAAMLTTTATTTANTVLTFASTTGAAAQQVIIGSGITGYVNVVSTTGTTVTVLTPVTVASGTPLYFGNSPAKFNTSVGVNCMGVSYQDGANSLVGTDAMRDSLGSNNCVLGTTCLRDGIHNRSVAIGASALSAFGSVNAVTTDNTAVGVSAMATANITTASFNTAIGSSSGSNLTSGVNNALLGWGSGTGLTTGSSNTFAGSNTGQHVTTGSGNIGLGSGSLTGVSAGATGGLNICVGSSTMGVYTSGTQNTIVGHSAGAAITTGSQNVTLGVLTGSILTTGSSNLVMGNRVASTTLATGLSNILLGVDSSCDTAAAGTSNTVLIKGASPGIAVLSATGTNGTPQTVLGGNVWAGVSVGTGGLSGPTWTSGAGVPASTQPNGSMYTNTSGTTGTRLYVTSGAGSWLPVAGV